MNRVRPLAAMAMCALLSGAGQSLAGANGAAVEPDGDIMLAGTTSVGPRIEVAVTRLLG